MKYDKSALMLVFLRLFPPKAIEKKSHGHMTGNYIKGAMKLKGLPENLKTLNASLPVMSNLTASLNLSYKSTSYPSYLILKC